MPFIFQPPACPNPVVIMQPDKEVPTNDLPTTVKCVEKVIVPIEDISGPQHGPDLYKLNPPPLPETTVPVQGMW